MQELDQETIKYLDTLDYPRPAYTIHVEYDIASTRPNNYYLVQVFYKLDYRQRREDLPKYSKVHGPFPTIEMVKEFRDKLEADKDSKLQKYMHQIEFDLWPKDIDKEPVIAEINRRNIKANMKKIAQRYSTKTK